MHTHIIYVYKGIIYHVLNALNDVIYCMYVLLCYYMFVFYIVMYVTVVCLATSLLCENFGCTGRTDGPIVLIFPEDVFWTHNNAELFF